MKLTPVFEVRATVGAPVEIGEVRGGRRRIVPITGGTFEGAHLRGTVLPGGADWQLIQADGFTHLDSRYVLQTDAGDLVTVQNAGIRRADPEVMRQLLAGQAVDPSLVYFRTVATFETTSAALRWLTQSIFVATGERYPSEVRIQFSRLD